MSKTKHSGNKKISRGDVARAAGVSATTVSHALNPPADVRMSAETKAKVCRIAREMGYRPNFFGKSLVTGRSFAIGLLQPEYEALFLEFYQHMAYGLASSMAQDDYNILMAFKDERKRYLKLVQQGRIDGMIVLQSKSSADEFNEIVSTGIPTIMLNQPHDCSEFDNCANISSDHEKFVDDIMEKLCKSRRKNILSVNDYNFCIPNFCVFDEFRNKAAELAKDGFMLHNLIPSDNFEQQLSNLFESGERFDGVYLDGEEFIDHYIKVASSYGMECGRDYDLHVSSVTSELSIDDFDFPLSLYIQKGEKMGAEAWKTMNKMINKEAFNKKIKIPYSELTKR